MRVCAFSSSDMLSLYSDSIGSLLVPFVVLFGDTGIQMVTVLTSVFMQMIRDGYRYDMISLFLCSKNQDWNWRDTSIQLKTTEDAVTADAKANISFRSATSFNLFCSWE